MLKTRDTDVVIVAYNVNGKGSFDAVPQKMADIMSLTRVPDVQKIPVGYDAEMDISMRKVSREEGEAPAKTHECRFFELCSC